MAKTAENIQRAGFTYAAYTSNSAARAICSGGGGGSKCGALNNNTPMGAPGLDLPSSVTSKPKPAQAHDKGN